MYSEVYTLFLFCQNPFSNMRQFYFVTGFTSLSTSFFSWENPAPGGTRWKRRHLLAWWLPHPPTARAGAVPKGPFFFLSGF